MSLDAILEGTLGSWAFLGVSIPLFIFLGLGAMGLTPPEFTFAKICFSLAVVVAMLSVARWLVLVTNESLPLLGRILCGFLVFGLLGASWVEVMRWVKRREKAAIIAVAHAEPQDQLEPVTPLTPAPIPVTPETTQGPRQPTPHAEQKLTQRQDPHPTETNKGDTAVPKRKDNQPPINQTMNNSPGGMQAGRDINNNFITVVDSPNPQVTFGEPILMNAKTEEGYQSQVPLHVISPFPIGSLSLTVHQETLHRIDLSSDRDMLMLSHSKVENGRAFVRAQNVRGELTLVIVTAEPISETNPTKITPSAE